MNQPWIYRYSPSRSPLPPPSPPDPSGSSQCSRPEHLSHASNLGWWSVSPLIIYMFWCCSLETSHPHSFLNMLCIMQWLFSWFISLSSTKLSHEKYESSITPHLKHFVVRQATDSRKPLHRLTTTKTLGNRKKAHGEVQACSYYKWWYRAKKENSYRLMMPSLWRNPSSNSYVFLYTRLICWNLNIYSSKTTFPTWV